MERYDITTMKENKPENRSIKCFASDLQNLEGEILPSLHWESNQIKMSKRLKSLSPGQLLSLELGEFIHNSIGLIGTLNIITDYHTVERMIKEIRKYIQHEIYLTVLKEK